MIDCDVHIEIRDTEEFLGFVEPAQRDWFRSQGPAFGLPGYVWAHPQGWFRGELEICPGDMRMPAASVDAIRREVLEPTGAEIAVLTPDDGVLVSLMGSAYRAAAYARAYNEWVRECFLARDSRLRGTILCPAQDPLAAAREIRRAAADERFVAVLLVGGSERPYGDPRYLPLLEAAAECGLGVMIHSGGEGMGLAAPPGGAGLPTFYIEWHTLGSACSIMAHLVSLLSHGTFERVAGLRVMLLEGGIAWLPGMLWRLETNWRGLRSEVPWLDRLPGEVLREHVRFTTQPLEQTGGNDELLWEMLAAVGAPGILCYSSDYPHWDFDDPGYLMRRLPDDWRQAVMHENAERFYGERLGLVAT